MSFRFYSTRAFLTYPQAAAIPSKEFLHDFLMALGATKVLVARELHQGGGVHYHACAEWTARFSSRDERVFDVAGCHPNIQRPRSFKSVLVYVVKGGDYVNTGFVLDEARSIVQTCRDASTAHSNVEDATIEVITTLGDPALKLLSQIRGFLGLLMRERAAYAPLHVWPEEFRLVFGGFRRTWVPAIEKFYANIELPAPIGTRDEFAKSLWIYGPSRMGKTHLARSLGRHWYMQSQWNAERLDASASYGVMDDIPWVAMQFNYKGMLGCQMDVTVTDKYRHKSVYRGGIPVVVVTNALPEFTDEEDAWLRANVDFVEIAEPVWNCE
jgi:hypothetical protein